MPSENLKAPNPGAWTDPEALQEELLNRNLPVDYRRITRDADLLLVGDSHFNGAIREHLARHARYLKRAGIKQLGVEYPKGSPWESIIRNIQEGGRDDGHWLNSLWAMGGAPREALNYDALLEYIAGSGIGIAPIDSVDYGAEDPERREPEITRNVSDLIEMRPKSKTAILIGASHTINGPHKVPSLRVRLMERRIPTTVVRFIGGFESLPAGIGSAVNGTGLVDREWMLDMSPYNSAPEEFGGAEFLVHLPRKEIIRTGILESVAQSFRCWLRGNL